MQQTVQFKGTFKFEKYTDNNGYSVCLYKNLSSNKNVTCRGYNLPKSFNVLYVFTVVEKNHPKYGFQYEVISYEEDISSIDVKEYLTKGFIKGIGPATAKKIYEKFGEDTLRVIDEEIEKLSEVKGISKKTIEKIKMEYSQKKQGRDLSLYLHSFGFTAAKVNRIIKDYPELTVEKIRTNPYILLRISGITFEVVDHMAMSEGRPEDCVERIEAAAVYVIKTYMQSGSVCMPIEEFCAEFVRILNTSLVNRDNVVGITIKLIEEKRLIFRKTADGSKKYIYLPHVARIEQELKNSILRIALNGKAREIKNLDGLIDKYAPFSLDDSQRQAVKDALTLPFSIITGGPGTGKTTILKIVDAITEYELRKENIYLAPTGRAARRMAESIGKPASTIHHGLGIMGSRDEEDFTYEYEEDCNVLDCEMVSVDEAGCVDMFLMNKLLGNIETGTRICLVGDVEQLESVKPGSVLRDIINSGIVKVNYLEYCHRQEECSSIMQNVLRIKKGITEMQTGTDFEIIESMNIEDVHDMMVNKYIEKVKEKGLLNVACICPFKDHKAGVREMNTELQARLNQSYIEVKGIGCVFKVGDPVMHLFNTDNLSNGDVGIITNIEEAGKDSVIEVTYYGTHKQLYKGDEIEGITLAYAITLHKAQGSEYPVVITCLTKFHQRMLRRSIPYTAFSRASEEDCFIGDKDALRIAIENYNPESRKTMLAYDLQRAYARANSQWVNVS